MVIGLVLAVPSAAFARGGHGGHGGHGHAAHRSHGHGGHGHSGHTHATHTRYANNHANHAAHRGARRNHAFAHNHGVHNRHFAGHHAAWSHHYAHHNHTWGYHHGWGYRNGWGWGGGWNWWGGDGVNVVNPGYVAPGGVVVAPQSPTTVIAPGNPGFFSVVGTIRAIRGNVVAVAPVDGAPVAVDTTPNTTIVLNSEQSTLADLRPTDRVKVRYDQNNQAITLVALR